jgi:DNA recombination protein RmuC
MIAKREAGVSTLELALGVLVLLLGVCVLALALRGGGGALRGQLDDLARDNERLERELRAAVDSSASASRAETGARLTELQTTLIQQASTQAGLQGQQLTSQLLAFGQQVGKLAETSETAARASREETARALHAFGEAQQQRLADLTHQLQSNLAEVRDTLQRQVTSLQQGNEAKLDQMRATVEEKLQSTLEARLGESFRQVSERLEQVHRGLGEMQTLAQGVGDLKKVLSNVKSRGTFGEVQLGALLEQVLAPEQYAANVATRPGSREVVEYAVRLPGRGGPGGQGETPCWLPIDAKFPAEDYERLLAAQDAADRDAVEVAARAIEARIRLDARTIREKYVEPPHTTDFAILFLPTEGLFAEVLRRPGLSEALNRELRIVIAGPTTLFAMLNSLQMGFRTLALEQRSAEVWQVLGAVKSEFGKFGDVLGRLKQQLSTASNTIEQAETRTRQMGRALKSVEELPAAEAARLLPPVPDLNPDDG